MRASFLSSCPDDRKPNRCQAGTSGSVPGTS